MSQLQFVNYYSLYTVLYFLKLFTTYYYYYYCWLIQVISMSLRTDIHSKNIEGRSLYGCMRCYVGFT